jgi:hypothetical protein
VRGRSQTYKEKIDEENEVEEDYRFGGPHAKSNNFVTDQDVLSFGAAGNVEA